MQLRKALANGESVFWYCAKGKRRSQLYKLACLDAVHLQIAPVFMVLTAIGWFLIVIGFGMGSQEVERVKDG